MDNMESRLKSEIKSVMQTSDVPAPAIKAACDAAAKYLPVSIRKTGIGKILRLEFSSVSLLTWVTSATIMVLCSIIIRSAASAETATRAIVVVSPLPLLFSLIELLRNRNPAVGELEKACKFNFANLYVIKLMIGLFANLVVLLVLVLFFAGLRTEAWHMLLLGSCVMFAMGFLALLFTLKFGNSLPVMAVLAAWILISSLLLSDNVLHLILSARIQFAALFLLLVVCASFYFFSVYLFRQKIGSLRIGDGKTCS